MPDLPNTPTEPQDESLTRPASSSPPLELQSPQQPEGAPAPARHDPYAVLRIPAFRRYLVGWFVIVFGGQVQSAAIRWDVYTRTNDPHALGLVGLYLALPILLFSLPFGALADKYDRRKIVILSTTLTALTAAALAIQSYFNAPLYVIYFTLFLSGTAQSLDRPARAAIVPTLVPLNIFSNAMTWISSLFQIASIAGPAVGGFLVGWHPWACYALYAVSSIGFLSTITALKGNFHPSPVANQKSQIANLLEGLRFVFTTKIIFATILLDLIAVLLAGTPYMLPVFVKDIIHLPPWLTSSTAYGLLNTAEAVGALAMGMLIAHLPPFKHAGRAMLLAVATFGACAIAFSLSNNFYLTFALLLLMGAVDNISVIVRHTLVNVLSPNAMRGRINAVNNIFIGSSNELGGYRAGSMAKLLGPIPSVLYGGIAAFLATAAVALAFPSVRALGKLKDIPPADDNKTPSH